MKKRLDILVYEKGFTDSREKAKAIIMSGQVYVDNQKADKCGTSYDENVKIEVRGNTQKYVSRGGLKLEKAIDNFDFDLKDKITMDIGASTGGFTDCMLQNGAKKVYSIDVGYGQLAWKLRNDPRVVNLERTNMRKVTREQVPDEIDFFSVDVSFISLKLILPVARQLMSENKGNFLLFTADYLVQQPCGGTLRFPCSVSVDIHCGTDISVSEKLLHIFRCCPI